jgi:hypothetical protein
LYLVSSAAPRGQPTVKYHPRWQPIQGLAVHYRLGRLRDSNPGLQVYSLVSLPKSHYCSHRWATTAPNQWTTSAPNQWATTAPNQWATTAPNQWATSAPNQWATTAPNQWATSAPKERSI